MTNLDEKDCTILNLLQEDCRASLTDIAKKVKLSVDSVKKRIEKMEKNGIFYSRIQIRPRSLGFNNIVDVKIKLKDHSKKHIDEFINYLQENTRVAEIFSVGGEWDLSIVIISKDLNDFYEVISDIKSRYGNMISMWNESITLKAHKFETYDVKKLLGFGNKNG